MKLLDIVILVNGYVTTVVVEAPTDVRGDAVVPSKDDEVVLAVRERTAGGRWLRTRPARLQT